MELELDGDSAPHAIVVVGASVFGEAVAAALSETGALGFWRRDEAEVSAALAEHSPSLVLVEMAEWSKSEAERCRRLGWSGVPVIALIGRGDSIDRACALDAGVDDCLTAPFASAELAARVRRTLCASMYPGAVFGDWRLDLPSREVVGADGRRICLARAELAVLRRLLLDRGRFTSSRALSLAATGPSGRPVTVPHLRVLLHRLRAKLGRDSLGRPAILCGRERGYALAAPVQGFGAGRREEAAGQPGSAAPIAGSCPPLPGAEPRRTRDRCDGGLAGRPGEGRAQPTYKPGLILEDRPATLEYVR